MPGVEFNGFKKDFSLEHDSRDEYYRFPVGAVEAKSRVRLRLRVRDARGELKVRVRLWQEALGETLVDMAPYLDDGSHGVVYSADIDMPEKGCLVWYYFILDEGHGKIGYYGNNYEQLGGRGITTNHEPGSFQITVYDEGAKTPDWFKNSVMYQIFPDRFCRKGLKEVDKPGAVMHLSDKDFAFYYKDVDTKEIVSYDFFGGNLAGIQSKLPYLKKLGISVIYLNPIFEAASNHRYDTGDYNKVDSLLGTNEEFSELCAEAEKLGIRIILDGVFSHTGSDSRYFNRYGRYDSVGAYQSKTSPFHNWYSFRNYPDDYESWWGFDTLPNVNETHPDYMDFIIRNKDSVLKNWIKRGASGWRLDVIDELPQKFSRAFFKELKETDPEAVLIGEVWEDASNKVAYGVPREYLCGHEMDSAMNYPFRQMVLDFLLCKDSSEHVAKRIENQKENYPKENFYAMMNLVGSHDRERILTLLGQAECHEGMPAIEQARYKLSEEKRELGLRRERLAAAWQMTFPGVPSVYYGDEIGMEGFKDPGNRGPYDWNGGDTELRNFYEKLIALRNEAQALRTGELLMLNSGGDVLSYARVIRNGKDVFGNTAEDAVYVVALNRSSELEVDASLDVVDIASGIFEDVLNPGHEIAVQNGRLKVTLPALSAGVYRLKSAVKHFDRKAGILNHPTSLPSPYGIGDFGKEAYAFADFLKAAGQSYWQILPLNPVGDSYSPYQSISALAGNELLISPEKLVEEKLLTKVDIKLSKKMPKGKEGFEAAKELKGRLLTKAYAAFKKNKGFSSAGWKKFIEAEKGWVQDYALYMTLKDVFVGRPWYEWPEKLAKRDAETLKVYEDSCKDSIGYHIFVQYIFHKQWSELKTYVNKKGIDIVGDMPLFVSGDSVDVWMHQELFDLRDDGRANTVAGVPPDYFSATGQLWGNPQYNWYAMEAEDYSWWKQRFGRLLELVDVIRIDHFRGLESYWEVDGDAENAIHGQWIKGPGKEFFDVLEKHFGKLPFIAEDLGIITPAVDELREECGLSGMKVLQFTLGFNSAGRVGFCAPENSIIYTGTHDNNTTVGWLTEDLDDRNREAVRHWLGASDSADMKELCNELIKKAYASEARAAMVPVWDILGLPASERMNTPGTAENNWTWRMEEGCLTKKHALELNNLVKQFDR